MTDTATPAVIAPDAALVEAQAAVDAAEAERIAAEAAAAAPVAPVVPAVPDKYEYKLPDGLTADAAIVERTTAIARELGLQNDAAQKLLDREVATLAEQETARAAAIEGWKPGGAEFVKRDEGWRTQAQADPELGKTPAEFATSMEKAQQGLAAIDPKGELKALLESSGFGSHPAALKALARIGRMAGEPGLVVGAIGGAPKPKRDADVLYPNHAAAS